MSNLLLDQWQRDVLKTEGNIVLRSGRQVGKSTVVSQLAGQYAATNMSKTIMVIAATERQAFLLFEKVLTYLETNHSKLIKTGYKDKPTKSRIRLRNGSTIYCLPTGADGRGIRGYTIDLLIADEAAFIADEVWAAVTPMMATRTKFGARMVLLSTPFGRRGFFYECFEDETFTKFHVSSEECERIDKDYLAAQRKRMSKLEYTQEYLGEFVDELMQYFPDELIKKCMTMARPDHIRPDPNYFLGVDIARMGGDESTFEILKLRADKSLVQVENQITTKTKLTETASHIINLNRAYNFNKIYIDDEGIGIGVFDMLLEEDSTKRKTVGINNSRRVLDHTGENKKKLLKQDLYANLLRLMEQGRIFLLDDPEVFLSLKSVQYEYTSDTQGQPRMKIFGNYTHVAEGLIRAAWCVSTKGLNIWIDTIKL